MSKIIGVTVGTSISPQLLKEKLKPVLSVNGQKPDENGNVAIEVGGGSILPSGYTLLEYIESSGTQYIDTGFIADQDTRMVCKTRLAFTGETNWLFGSRYASGSRKFAFAASSSSYYSAHYNTSNPRFDKTVAPTGVFVVDFNKQDAYIEADGETYTTTASVGYAEFETHSNMLLFACITGTSIAYGSAAIYSCQIYDNGTLVRDFVPCINPYGVYGLYDKVNEQFYANAGTGEFSGVAASKSEDTMKLFVATDALPAASQSWWSKMAIVPSEDTDKLYICLRLGGNYTWREFFTGTPGSSAATYLVDANGNRFKTADGMYLSVNV